MPAGFVAVSSRAIVVIGMHRSGTSAVARGLAALGVDLGDDFLDAQPENPTGYWEDRGIVELNERVLRRIGLKWDDSATIDLLRFSGWRMWRLRREAQPCSARPVLRIACSGCSCSPRTRRARSHSRRP